MRFNYIIIAFSTNRRPPSFNDINNKNCDFVFSPLAKDKIYSADTALWGINGEGTFAPSAQHVQKCLKEWQENDHLFLMALIEHKDVKKGLFSPVVSIENVFKAEDIDKAVFVGYDVIDIWTGISVLCNAGFGSNDLELINNSGITCNSHGLLNNMEDSAKFLKVASGLVPEHMPCVISEIYIYPNSAI